MQNKFLDPGKEWGPGEHVGDSGPWTLFPATREKRQLSPRGSQGLVKIPSVPCRDSRKETRILNFSLFLPVIRHAKLGWVPLNHITKNRECVAGGEVVGSGGLEFGKVRWGGMRS